MPATPVNTVEQVTNDPRTATRRMIERVVHPKLGEIPVVGMPTKFSGMQTGGRRPAPLHGEHTDEVLAGCGDAPEEIVALRTKEVVR